MQQAISAFLQGLRRVLLLIGVVSLFNLVSWSSPLTQPSYAVSSPQEALQEIKRDQAEQSRTQAYEEAVEVTENPKMGVEKAYEEEMAEFRKEHPDEGGIVEGAKELVGKVTGDR